MNRLTKSQVKACVDSATRGTKAKISINLDCLTEALNTVLVTDLNGQPGTHMAQWCDVCQRNVDTNHAHDKMVQTSDHHHSP